jgi:hypothetical protein
LTLNSKASAGRLSWSCYSGIGRTVEPRYGLAGQIDELEPLNLGSTGEEQDLLKAHLDAAGYVLKLFM